MKTSKWGLWKPWCPDERLSCTAATSDEVVLDDLQLLSELWQKIAIDLNKVAVKTDLISTEPTLINYNDRTSKCRYAIMIEEYRLVIRPITWREVPVGIFGTELEYQIKETSAEFDRLSLEEKSQAINKLRVYPLCTNKTTWRQCRKISNSLKQAKSCINRLTRSNRQK